MENFYVVAIKAGGDVYLLLDDRGEIVSYENEEKGVKSFEDIYNDYHKRDYSYSAATCINYITFQPSIIKVKDLEEIKELLLVENEEFCPRTLSHITGTINGILLKKEIGEKLWDEGAKPRLIS